MEIEQRIWSNGFYISDISQTASSSFANLYSSAFIESVDEGFSGNFPYIDWLQMTAQKYIETKYETANSIFQRLNVLKGKFFKSQIFLSLLKTRNWNQKSL